MATVFQDVALHLVLNGQSDPKRAYDHRQREIIDLDHTAAARREIANWPGYQPTPLLSLPALAFSVGFERLWCKNEGERFAIRSFKALGGAYAVLWRLQQIAAERLRGPVSAAMLVAGEARPLVRDVVVACASDGNHGAAVAWGAQMFGCRSVVYLPGRVNPARAAAIERLGARVVRIDGVYDDAVDRLAADCRRHGWINVPDTSASGDNETPAVVMRGYTLLAEEILDQLPKGQLPTHVFLQGGVGGFAAAVVAFFWRSLGARRPRVVVVEPTSAACLAASAAAARPVSVGGDLDTVMGCLACGQVSRIAWEILQDGVDAFLTLSDDAIAPTMLLLSEGLEDDPPIFAGESGAAGIAAVLAAAAQEDIARALALAPDSRVLTICTEGPIDVASFRRLTGRTPPNAA